MLGNLAEFEALGAEWSRLTGPDCEPMQSHAWHVASIRHLCASAKLRVLVVRDGEQLVGALPLVEFPRRGVTWLEIPGASLLHEPADLLADGPETLALLCRALVDQRMPVALQRLDLNGPARAALATAARRRSALATPGGGSCLRVETTGGWPAFLQKISGSRRNTLQRKRRLLEQHAAVSMRRVVPDVGSVREALRTAFEVEARSWKGAGGSAVLQRPQAFEFFVELGSHFAAGQRLEIRLLQVGSALAASQVGIVAGQRWWELKIGYDPRWSKFSPGMLLGWEGLQDAFERKLDAHEFLGSSAPWQRPFATSERVLQTLVLYPYNAAGLWALGMDVASFAWARGRAALRSVVARSGAATRDIMLALRHRTGRLRASWFDWRHGVETMTPVPVNDIRDIDPSIAAHAVHYEATSFGKFSRAMDILAPRYEGSTFVDLGSGKGRVLLLAALRPFRRVIGVEISASLHARALANVAAFARRNPRARAVECVCADASEYELPEGDLVVFLYNPFDTKLLGKACERMLAAFDRAPRELAVVYVNPVHFEVFERGGRFERVSRDASLAVYRLHPKESLDA